MGSSINIAIGSLAMVSQLIGTMLRDELDPNTQEHRYFSLASATTFFAGVTQTALSLGFQIDFLSHATIVGFMGGYHCSSAT
ncbi:putative SLC26A/SulP transporter [Helianthus anomalus]